MEQDISNEHNWSDVFFAEEPHPTLSYRSGMVVYEESLIKGGFVSRAWNGSGYVNAWEDVRLDPAQHSAPQSFWLEIDGQLLASHWGMGRFRKERGNSAWIPRRVYLSARCRDTPTHNSSRYR